MDECRVNDINQHVALHLLPVCGKYVRSPDLSLIVSHCIHANWAFPAVSNSCDYSRLLTVTSLQLINANLLKEIHKKLNSLQFVSLKQEITPNLLIAMQILSTNRIIHMERNILKNK